MLKIVTVSDTHNMGKEINVPDGDILLHAGDHTMRGTQKEGIKALEWLSSLPHKYKIFIAGNHDWFLDPKAPREFRNWKLYRHYTIKGLLEKFPDLIYLQDSSVEIEGLKIYGSPWQPWYYDWAFNFPLLDGASRIFPEQFRDRETARKKWAEIPKDTNILITHVPPTGIGDKVWGGDDHIGCPDLRDRLFDLKSLKLHVFGHIHSGYGTYTDDSHPGATFINAAIATEDYYPYHKPISLEIG